MGDDVTTWLEDMRSAAFLAELESSVRCVSARTEFVDIDGNAVEVDGAVDALTVDFKGESAQNWAGSATVSDKGLVPVGSGSPLDPRARLRVRHWWRLLKPGGVEAVAADWWEIPLATLRPGDLSLSAGRAGVSMTVPLDDVLEEAQRGGYGGATLQLGGANVADALRSIFEMVLPGAPVVVGSTSTTLPSPYEVGGGTQTVQQDWTAIAATAGWVVRSDRLGVIVCGPQMDPGGQPLDWQEGPLCAVTDLDRSINFRSMVNRVVCRSTSPEVDPPVFAVVEDTDPSSSTFVGRFVWQTEIKSDAVTTTAACENMARATFERYRRPLETVKLTIPQRPDLGYRQLAQVARMDAGVAGEYAVSAWTIRTGPKPEPMSVTMMERSIR